MEDQLKRNIFESILTGQERTRASQAELDAQGKKLTISVNDAGVVAKQTIKTGVAVDRLLIEKKLSKTQRILRCCCYCCYKPQIEGPSDIDPTISHKTSPSEREDDDKDSLIGVAGGIRLRRKPSWKKTLTTNYDSSYDIWYRQVDASLTQLQMAAEEMEKSLDEQIKLAQILTIYLNYGVDQVIDINKNLAPES